MSGKRNNAPEKVENYRVVFFNGEPQEEFVNTIHKLNELIDEHNKLLASHRLLETALEGAQDRIDALQARSPAAIGIAPRF